MRALGRQAEVVTADLADRHQCQAVIDRAMQRFGRVDALVQNGHHAGDWRTVVGAQADDWQAVFDVNFFAAMHLVRAAAEVMIDGSSIVLVNSGAALRNPPTMGAYSASKAALASLVRTSAVELGPRIRVNGIFLGPVTGESMDNGAASAAASRGLTVDEWLRQRAEELPVRHIPTPDECAGAVLFLCSSLAAAVTGQHLSVNGGQWVT